VPEKEVLARIEGNWQDKLYYTLGSKPFAKVAVGNSEHLNSLDKTDIS
jgi:hypothetical protein